MRRLLVIAVIVLSGCSGSLSDAEKAWCSGPHAPEIRAAAAALGIDDSKWNRVNPWADPTFIRACKTAYEAR